MNNTVIKGKCLYTPKGAAREYAPLACNFYRGCPHKCLYCYNRKGLTAPVLGIDHAVLKDKFAKPGRRAKKYRALSGEDYAITVFRQDVEKYLPDVRTAGIFFSFTTDPMVKETMALTVCAMLYAVSKGIPVRILTKNADFSAVDKTVFKSLPKKQRRLVYMGFTLTGRDDQEPHASPNSERIAMLRQFHEWGYHTFASIEPVVDFKSSYRMVVETAGCCDLYMIGLMNHAKDYYKSCDNNGFQLEEMIRSIFLLQQLHGFKVYYKDSVIKNAENILNNVYMEGLTPYSLGLSSEKQGSLYDDTDNRTWLQKAINAIVCLNRFLNGHPTDDDSLFFLSQYNDVCVKEHVIEDFFDDFLSSPDSFFPEKVCQVYNDLADLQTEALKLHETISRMRSANMEGNSLLIELERHAAHIHDIILNNKQVMATTKPLLL